MPPAVVSPGDGTTGANDLSFQCDDGWHCAMVGSTSYRAATVSRPSRTFVEGMACGSQIMCYPDALQQMVDRRGYLIVEANGACSVSNDAVGRGRRDRSTRPQTVQREERCTTGPGPLQMLDGLLCVLPRLCNHVLQGSTECDFNCALKPVRYLNA